MFFVLSKALGVLFDPTTFLVLVAALGLTLHPTRFARAGRRLALGAAIVFALVCFSPLSALLLRPLEDRFPQPSADLPAPAGIVVLGGALDEGMSAARGQPSLNEAAGRLTAGVALALRYPQRGSSSRVGAPTSRSMSSTRRAACGRCGSRSAYPRRA